MKVLYLQLDVRMDNCQSIKERRACAQKLTQLVKNHWNVSAKIQYSTVLNQFQLLIIALGETEDYLEKVAEEIHLKTEIWIEEVIMTSYDIEPWPL